MQLRRSLVGGHGFTRKRRGQGFRYDGVVGERLTDTDGLPRMAELVISPGVETCGSVRTPTVIPRWWGPTLPGGVNTSITKPGGRNALRRSSTACWRCRSGWRRGGPR